MLSPKEARAKWVEALRSGKYKQISGALEISDKKTGEVIGNCCLGVANRLYLEDGGILQIEQKEHCGDDCLYTHFNDSYIVLSSPVIEWLGLKSSSTGRFFRNDQPYYLTELNDNGRSFEEIAQIIEDGLLHTIDDKNNESETSGKNPQKVD